jgi:hypothetical protein
MDQEREKLARLYEEAAVRCTDSRYGRKNEPLCHPCTMKLLQQWGDLRAEQVRRETVSRATALCSNVYGDEVKCYGTDEPRAVGKKIERALRRAFAASQGGP